MTPSGRAPTYDKRPVVPVDGHALAGWPAIVGHVAARLRSGTIAVDCYPGVDTGEVLAHLRAGLDPACTVDTRDLMLTPERVEQMVDPWLGDDPVFGRMSPLDLPDFLDPAEVAAARRDLMASGGLRLVIGPGAALVDTADLLVFADLPRWEIQQRQRGGRIGNLGADNAGGRPAALYKRAYFVDWRAADRHKRRIWSRIDLLLDTTRPGDPRLVEGTTLRQGLSETAHRPFRVVPFFDPAPWGGQWMRQVCGLDPEPPNYGWCFDCVPEENSLVLGFGGVEVEVPAQDLVYAEPRALLGDPVHARFGAEFPIRFDFLDTMGGGNLSLQVHPLTEYIQEQFGMHYTQDESYYLLDAEPGAQVYLGLRDGVDPAEFRAALQTAATDPDRPLAAERFAGVYPASKHDHFLIPAGTLHCSGAGSMVLEISATPYIFTFKQWDWGRLGLDGLPRPVHLEHGMNVLQWDRQEQWVRRNLINRVTPLDSGPGWRTERTGLHEREFIETVRTWFDSPYPASTGGLEAGSVHVLNLIEGPDAVVESPTGAFPPFPVHYAETFIVPAAVGDYSVRPGPEASANGAECGTITAYVRSKG